MKKKREKRRSAPASDSPDLPTGPERVVILITGAAGNLGSLLARHLLSSGHELRLMYHRSPLAADLVAAVIYAAACACELGATVARTASPLTRDFVRLGRVPHWGDTRRAREELVPELVHPTMESGLSTL